MDYRCGFKNALVFTTASAASARPRPGRWSRPLIFDQKTAPRVRLNSVRTIMRISARNQIRGTVIEVKKGATTSHVRVDIGQGQIVTSAITNEAVDELGLKVGQTAYAIVKASDVMVGLDS